jgi:hypothetical protein
MGSNAQRRREARERVQAMRKQEAARQRRRHTLFGIGLAVVVVLAIGGIAWAVKVGTEQDTAEPVVADIEGVKSYDYTAQEHTDEPVDYKESPPVGGPHDPTWQNCEIYDQPVRNENAVHSLEHGAVWIAYDPDLPQASVDSLKEHVDGNFILMSPYPGLKTPIVLSAWNTQLALGGIDERLDQFITKYRQGEQTPELGAPCTGGTSETVGS